ncbi:MAG: ATP-binding protein [Thermoleophilia bacterium]|nr:ATP-binding protein [Thermoleophilia bacterium]
MTVSSTVRTPVPGSSIREGQTVRLAIPARAEYISLCRLALAGVGRTRGLDDELVADLKLALTEACTNSIRHAYPQANGIVEVVYDLFPDRLVIEVADSGAGFARPPGARLEASELSEGGLGMAIIEAIADELEIGPGAGGRGATLRLVKRLPG